MDIAAWLRGLGLEQYEPAFRDNAIDGAVLPRLTSDDLKGIGVAQVGHRRKLLDAIAALGVHAPALTLSTVEVTPQAVALLSAHGTVASSIIQERVIYASAMTDGRTTVDIDPKGAASAEIFALWRFLQERMKDDQGGKEGRKKVA